MRRTSVETIVRALNEAWVRCWARRLGALLLLALLALGGCALLFPLPAPRERNYAIDLALPPAHAGPPPGPFLAGAAAVDITPDPAETTVWLAGFDQGRKATGVHDPLWARAVVLDDGRLRVALVALDLIGLFYQDTIAVRQALDEDLRIDYLAIASTHNHEGPDTLGLWGPHRLRTGVDPAYLARVRGACVDAVEAATGDLRPAVLRAAAAPTGTDGFIRDGRRPHVLDDEIAVLHLREPDGPTIATLLVWGNHPEAMGDANTLLTSDFPHALRETVEAALGGTCIFYAGAVGGLMTPLGVKVPGPDGAPLPKDTFEMTEALGRNVAAVALTALARDEAPPQTLPALGLRARTLTVPLHNRLYRLGARLGVIDRGFDETGPRTEVGRIEVGDASLLLVPGEIYPEIVLGGIEQPENADYADLEGPVEVPPLKPLLRGRVKAVVGLANDELGYIIPKTQWDQRPPFTYGNKLPPYGEINSVGPEAGPTLHRALVEVIEGDPPLAR